MKRLSRHIVQFLLMQLLLVMGSPMLWAYDFTHDGINYTIRSQSGHLVSVSKGSYSGAVTIPSTVSHDGASYTVTSIDDEAFSYSRELTQVSLPATISTIGISAFDNCAQLTTINIPSGVTAIEDETFYNCSALSHITLPSSLVEIGSNAFAGCRSLASLSLPSATSTVGSYAFQQCTSLQSLTATGLTSVPPYMAVGCTSLRSAALGNGVQAIGEYAFSGCSSLTAISLSTIVQTIDDYAFQDCARLTSIEFPGNLASVSSCAFTGSGLHKLIVTDSGNHTPLAVTGTETAIPVTLDSLVLGRAFTGNAIDPASSAAASRYMINVGQLSYLEFAPNYDATFNPAHYSNRLNAIYAYNVNPSAINSFHALTYMSVTLHVPQGSLSLYKSTQGWNNFKLYTQVDELVVKGDVNRDGIINVGDVTALNNMILGKPADSSFQNADMNGDGIINVTDTSLLIKLIVTTK